MLSSPSGNVASSLILKWFHFQQDVPSHRDEKNHLLQGLQDDLAGKGACSQPHNLLGLIPRTHMMEKENRPQIVLSTPSISK